jgi:hypothetical protein
MVKNVIMFFLIIGLSFLGCNKEDSVKENERLKLQKIEKLKKGCSKNETIEEWIVKKITPKQGNLKEISLIRKNDNKETKINVEGFDDLKEESEVLVKVSINDLSLNQKYGDKLVATEFLTIVDY